MTDRHLALYRVWKLKPLAVHNISIRRCQYEAVNILPMTHEGIQQAEDLANSKGCTCALLMPVTGEFEEGQVLMEHVRTLIEMGAPMQDLHRRIAA